MEKLHQDYREFIKLLNENSVEYMVVGAFAMAFHGLPRNTGDIDLWVNNSLENSKHVYKTILDFGFDSRDISCDDFTSDDLIFQMGYPPVRIDLITSIEALNFKDCYPRRRDIVIDELTIPFLNIESDDKKKATGC